MPAPVAGFQSDLRQTGRDRDPHVTFSNKAPQNHDEASNQGARRVIRRSLQPLYANENKTFPIIKKIFLKAREKAYRPFVYKGDNTLDLIERF